MKNRIFIIAEAGVNHNGSVDMAKRLIDSAVDAGADAVKFQTFKSENVISRGAPKAEYQKETTDSEESQLDMVKKLELSIDSTKDLADYCKKKEIVFLSSAFDLESIDVLNGIGLKILKIPSGEITNLPYLRKIGKLRKKIILSTGMSDLGEIEDALEILIESGTEKENIIVLHCSTEYPIPMEEVNLHAMLTIADTFKTKVGYSDHTKGVEVAIAAASLGAVVIEKHFTLDNNLNGPDHKASLEPQELKEMIRAIRNIEKALGCGIKKPSLSECKNKIIVRKSIVAKSKIEKGTRFTIENITVKRPGKGISPLEWDRVLGQTAKRSFAEDELIEI